MEILKIKAKLDRQVSRPILDIVKDHFLSGMIVSLICLRETIRHSITKEEVNLEAGVAFKVPVIIMDTGVSTITIYTLLVTMGLIDLDLNWQLQILGKSGIMVFKVLESEIMISMGMEIKVSMDKEIKFSMVKGTGCSKTKGARVSKQKIFKFFRNKDLGILITMETKISNPRVQGFQNQGHPGLQGHRFHDFHGRGFQRGFPRSR